MCIKKVNSDFKDDCNLVKGFFFLYALTDEIHWSNSVCDFQYHNMTIPFSTVPEN